MKKIALFLIGLLNCLYAQTPSLQWQKCYGGSTIDAGTSVYQTTDGDYILCGSTESNNGQVSGLHNAWGNYNDYWVVRIDNAGNFKWGKCLGGALDDFAQCVRQSPDGGFIIAGTLNMNGGGSQGPSDCYIVKLDSAGNIKWQKTYGGGMRKTRLPLNALMMGDLL